MPKPIVLDVPLITALGLGDQLLSLTGPPTVREHPELGEPLVALPVAGPLGTLWLERAQVRTDQLAFRPRHAAGTAVLAWWQLAQRRRGDANVRVPLASAVFLMDDAASAVRFITFVRSQRILDAEARAWLAAHHAELPTLAQDAAGTAQAVRCLTHLGEWPDLDSGNAGMSGLRRATFGGGGSGVALEQLARTFPDGLAALRASAHVLPPLLALPPDRRFTLFRVLAHAPTGGVAAVTDFITRLSAATGIGTAATAPLDQAISALRAWLQGPNLPPHA